MAFGYGPCVLGLRFVRRVGALLSRRVGESPRGGVRTLGVGAAEGSASLAQAPALAPTVGRRVEEARPVRIVATALIATVTPGATAAARRG